MSQEGYRCRDPGYIAPPHSAVVVGLPYSEGRGMSERLSAHRLDLIRKCESRASAVRSAGMELTALEADACASALTLLLGEFDAVTRERDEARALLSTLRDHAFLGDSDLLQGVVAQIDAFLSRGAP